MQSSGALGLALALIPLLAGGGCGSGEGSAPATILRVEGSDTMVNIAQAWAERYHQKHPDVSVQVLGGGSGVGIASLISGNCDLANTSRKMTEKELGEVRARHRQTAVEHIVGFDALGVYVHPRNPLDSITIEELAEIYGEEGELTRWSQLGVPEGVFNDEIVRIGRQNSSGTYEYFRNVILGKKRDFKLGSVDANGSKDVVALVSRYPSAIGYSGMGYQTAEVKMLKIAKRRGSPAIAPTAANALQGTYPITRPLQIYTIGEPAGAARRYLDWIKSPEGQEVVTALGYVPLR
jgi:phosphate transport system substrate-binding protein